MGQVLFVVWRESVEALLVVGILYAWLKNGDSVTKKGLPYLWLGVALGFIFAAILGAVLLGLAEILPDLAQDYFQIVLVFTACLLIVQMVFWMRKHGRSLKRNMESQLQSYTSAANWSGITLLVTLAIAREGSETVIFLYGLGFGQGGVIAPSMWLAVVLGLALAFLTFYLLQLGGKIFSWPLFFSVTEIILLFLAAGLLQTGIDKLIGLEWLPVIKDAIWNTSYWLDDSSTLGSLMATLTGYRARPSLMNLGTYLLFWIAIIYGFRCSRVRSSIFSARK